MPVERLDAEREGQPYAGRWVARVRGKIIAQGATRAEAYNNGRSSRPKERLEIVFMFPVIDHPLLKSVLELLPPDQPLYLVGGAVRDALLGRTTHDLDFAVPGGALKLARRLADKLPGAFFPLDEETDTARVIVRRDDGGRDVLDFAVSAAPTWLPTCADGTLPSMPWPLTCAAVRPLIPWAGHKTCAKSACVPVRRLL